MTDGNGDYALAILAEAQFSGLQTGGFCDGLVLEPEILTQYGLKPHIPQGVMRFKKRKNQPIRPRKTKEQLLKEQKIIKSATHFVAFLIRSKLNVDAADAVIVFNPLNKPCIDDLACYAITGKWGEVPIASEGPDCANLFCPDKGVYRPTFMLSDLGCRKAMAGLLAFLRTIQPPSIFVIGDSHSSEAKFLPLFLNLVLSQINTPAL